MPERSDVEKSAYSDYKYINRLYKNEIGWLGGNIISVLRLNTWLLLALTILLVYLGLLVWFKSPASITSIWSFLVVICSFFMSISIPMFMLINSIKKYRSVLYGRKLLKFIKNTGPIRRVITRPLYPSSPRCRTASAASWRFYTAGAIS